MAKYSLVAVKYCNGKVVDEVNIKLEGASCSNLISMDSFTSNVSYYYLWNEIRLIHDLDNSYELAIKYIRKRGTRPDYFDIIVDNKIISSCCNNIGYRRLGDFKISYVIDKRNPYFLKVYNSLIDIIDNYNFEDYGNVYFSNNDKLLELVEEYLKSDDKKLLDSIRDELSMYVTFRNFIVNLERLRRQEFIKKCVASNEELADEYNKRYLDEGIEEFIEPWEVEKMGLVDDGFVLERSRRKY